MLSHAIAVAIITLIMDIVFPPKRRTRRKRVQQYIAPPQVTRPPKTIRIRPIRSKIESEIPSGLVRELTDWSEIRAKLGGYREDDKSRQKKN